jgi:hypothetical protein
MRMKMPSGIKMEIPGVVIDSGPLFSKWPFSIYLGYLEKKIGDESNDIRHYLIINDEHGVVEGSTPRIVMARTALEQLAKEHEDYNKNPTAVAGEKAQWN